MVDPHDYRADGLPSGIEAMIREAAELPPVSPDLRPRVLRAAMASHERRSRRRLATVVALVALVLLTLSPPAGQRWEDVAAWSGPRRNEMARDRVAGDGQLLAGAVDLWSADGSDREWALVDRFSRLRQAQLRMLREAF